MLNMSFSVCINAPAQKVWEVLADLPKITEWSEAVIAAEHTGETDYGVGAERMCTLKNKITITESIIDWKDGEYLTYVGKNIPMVKHAKNTWSIEVQGDNSILTTTAQVVLKGGIFGKLLEPLMMMMSKKMSADTLAAFKYLVENGHPYEGKHSSLPRPLMHC